MAGAETPSVARFRRRQSELDTSLHLLHCGSAVATQVLDGLVLDALGIDAQGLHRVLQRGVALRHDQVHLFHHHLLVGRDDVLLAEWPLDPELDPGQPVRLLAVEGADGDLLCELQQLLVGPHLGASEGVRLARSHAGVGHQLHHAVRKVLARDGLGAVVGAQVGHPFGALQPKAKTGKETVLVAENGGGAHNSGCGNVLLHKLLRLPLGLQPVRL
mmetsp:Transcript_7075/g.17926  ORF Transcript_7075/g.17926 Transcript_7075/m.17926 type:complete len:216 (-) Transcript_7075:490-1137(-)